MKEHTCAEYLVPKVVIVAKNPWNYYNWLL